MRLVAAVPVKRLALAKSRLRVADRGAITVRMFEHVLHALMGSRAFEAVAVVSPDEEVLSLSRGHSAVALPQACGGLNDACNVAAAWARERNAQGLLVAHADLPRLDAEDVRRLVARILTPPLDGHARRVVMAPDRRGTGTNMLLAAPPHAVPFAFGPGSRQRHRDLARRGGVAVCEFFSCGTSHDVDTAQDLIETFGPPRPVPIVEDAPCAHAGTWG